MHTLIYMTAMNKTLHLAVLPDNPRRILDVGFGSGYWMLTMASKYPDTEIIGFDLDNVRHNSQERNCFFRTPVDFNAPLWDIEDASVDLVHLSQLCGCVPDWHHLYTKAYRSLRPGTGQIEHIELDWTPRSTERQLPPQAQALSNWWAWTLHASQLAGKPLDYREDTEELLERAGFVDIGHKRVRVPLFYPGTRDKREYLLSHGYQMAMGYTNSQSFTGFSMALLTRYFGWTPQQVADICANALAVVQQTPLPLYITLCVFSFPDSPSLHLLRR
jgi:ubiquinone/menaquinone biosynthesis C-methylase UbiE